MQIIITADKCNAPVFFLQKRLQKAQMQTGKIHFLYFPVPKGGYMKQKFKSVKEKMNKLCLLIWKRLENTEKIARFAKILRKWGIFVKL